MASKYASMFERLVANTRVEGECWIWTGPTTQNGYPKINVWRDGKTRTVRANRLMLEETTGFLFPFDESGHFHCFNTLCIAPHHLRVETKAENLAGRRGVHAAKNHTDDRLIPVLFPMPEKLLEWAAEDAWDGIGSVRCAPGEACPF